jgi:hypothetical protein
MILNTNYLANHLFGLYYNNQDLTFINIVNFMNGANCLLIVMCFTFSVCFFYFVINLVIKLIAFLFYYYRINRKAANYKFYFLFAIIMFNAYKVKRNRFGFPIDDYDSNIVYEKGKGFDNYKAFVNELLKTQIDTEDENYTPVTKTMELINCLLLSTIIAFYANGLYHIVPTWITILLTVYCVFYPFNLAWRYITVLNLNRYWNLILQTKTKE